MLRSLFTRATVPSVANIAGATVDAYGRVGRFGDYVDAGTYVDENTTLTVSAVWRGINLISDAIGSLPIHAYKNGERIEPCPSILLRPAYPETAVETYSAMVGTLILHGNYVAVLGPPNSTGWPDIIYPVAPTRVSVTRDNGRLVYKIDDMVFNASEVMHIKAHSRPGSDYGLGLLQTQRQLIGSALAINEYAAKYFAGGTAPTGIIKSANPDLTQQEADLLKSMWLQHYGGRNREPAVLNATTDFTPITDNAQQAQLIESRTFSLTEVANALGIPAYYLGAPNTSRTYSNVESENMQLIRWSLTPWLTRVEQAMSDLLPRGQYAKFNLDSLLRGDTNSRYQAHKIGIEAGFLTVDEVRQIEDKPVYLAENDTAEMIEAPETENETELPDMAGDYADD